MRHITETCSKVGIITKSVTADVFTYGSSSSVTTPQIMHILISHILFPSLLIGRQIM